MRLAEAIESMVEALLAGGVSDKTITSYRTNLGQMLRFLGDKPVEEITRQDVRRYAAHLRSRPTKYHAHPYRAEQNEKLSPFTVDSYIRSAKRLFNWLVDEGIIAESPMRRMRWIKPGRHEPKAISLEDFSKLLEAAKGDSPREIRNTGILLLMADTGCRVGGIEHLRLQDVDFENRVVTLTEKGDKTRKVPISTPVVKALKAWLLVRPDLGEPCFFVNMGTHGVKKLTGDAVGEIFRRLKKKAGIKGPANPHSLRHAFAREYIRNGGDMATLAETLGHSSIDVTWKFYAIFRVEELKKKHDSFSPVARMDAKKKGAEHDNDGRK